MTKKTRTLLFFILLFCFLVIAPSIVFYSWGYRFNFETKKIVKTGAFYFKVLPKSAQIYLTPFNAKGSLVKETKLLKRTDFFFGAVLIENLLPKRYEIEIKKTGFYPWKKILEIKENQVTETKNIVLMPEDIGLNLLTKEAEDFFFSPDEKIVILKETNDDGWALKLLELEKNVKSHLMESKDISKDAKVNLLDLKFSSDSKRLLLKIDLGEEDKSSSSPFTAARVKQRLKYYLLDLNQVSSKIIKLDFLDEELDELRSSSPTKSRLRDEGGKESEALFDFANARVVDELRSSSPFANARVSEEVFFHPKNPQKLFVFKKGEIFEADLTQKKISPKLLENIKSFQILNEEFYYLDNSGFLFKTDFSFSNREKINNQPFSLEKDLSYPSEAKGGDEGKLEGTNFIDYQIDVFLDWIFISDGQKIYFFNLESDSFEKFGDTNKQLKISPDYKKIAYASDYEIWILFLKPEFGQPQKESKEQLFIARFSEKMGEIFFFTNHYLIFNNGWKIKIAETDDRDIINIVDLAEFESPKIFWNQIYKKLFILSNGNFYSSRALIP